MSEDGAARRNGSASKAYYAPKQASSHYNRLTEQSWKPGAPRTFNDARVKRWEDQTYQLKEFHNEVKRAMINGLCPRGKSLLDLACGRGGDMNKWFDAGVSEVLGIDISSEEINTANIRFADLLKRKRMQNHPYVFQVRDDIGTAPIDWKKKYDSVTCMFAAHYFFATEDTVKMFLRNVAHGLNDKGYFSGTLPSGKHVLQCLGGRDSYRSSLLSIKRTWPGRFAEYTTFGSGYTFAIVKTITNNDYTSDEVGDGCEEYLVFMGAFTQLASLYHLYPDPKLSWDFQTRKNRGEAAFFERGPVDGKHDAFRMFKPRYDQANPNSVELEKISHLNCAFAFIKDESRPCSKGCLLHVHDDEPSVSVHTRTHTSSNPTSNTTTNSYDNNNNNNNSSSSNNNNNNNINNNNNNSNINSDNNQHHYDNDNESNNYNAQDNHNHNNYNTNDNNNIHNDNNINDNTTNNTTNNNNINDNNITNNINNSNNNHNHNTNHNYNTNTNKNNDDNDNNNNDNNTNDNDVAAWETTEETVLGSSGGQRARDSPPRSSDSDAKRRKLD